MTRYGSGADYLGLEVCAYAHNIVGKSGAHFYWIKEHTLSAIVLVNFEAFVLRLLAFGCLWDVVFALVLKAIPPGGGKTGR